MKFLPQTFFLCHNLKTGGIAVGWIGVFVSLPSWWILTQIAANSKLDPRIDILVGGTIGGILSLLVNALLVYGSKKDSWRFLVPWLAFAIIEMSVSLADYVRIINVMTDPHKLFDPVFIWFIIVIFTVGQVIYIYCWLCVLSLSKNLNEFSIPGRTHLQGRPEQDAGVPIYGNVA